MAFNYSPEPRPTGINNRSNDYYKRENHVRIARRESNRQFFLTDAIQNTPPSVLPSTTPFEIGVALTMTHGTYTPVAGGSMVVSAAWRIDQQTVSKADVYTPVLADQGKILTGLEIAEETGIEGQTSVYVAIIGPVETL